MAKRMEEHKCVCSCVGDNWFYLALMILIGIVLLLINLGLLTSDWIAYWPTLLIIIGVKEIVERN